MIETVLFTLGGVLVEPLAEVAIGRLEDSMDSNLTPPDRLIIRDLALDLQLGRIDEHNFCSRVLSPGQIQLDKNELAIQIQDNVKEKDGVLDIVEELAERFHLHLISDYPRNWLMTIHDRLDLLHHFKETATIFIPELGFTSLNPDVFYYAVRSTGRPISDCLLVDARSEVTSAAVRAGLNAIIFVNSYRLREEFVLRELIPANDL